MADGSAQSAGDIEKLVDELIDNSDASLAETGRLSMLKLQASISTTAIRKRKTAACAE